MVFQNTEHIIQLFQIISLFKLYTNTVEFVYVKKALAINTHGKCGVYIADLLNVLGIILGVVEVLIYLFFTMTL